MSYEIIKKLHIKGNEVFISCSSNNVFPRYYTYRKCEIFSQILQQQGIAALNLEILKLYESGSFQEGTPNIWSRAIERLKHTQEYQERFSWRLENYNDPNCPINANRNSKEFDVLLLNALQLKPLTSYFLVQNMNYAECYVLRITSKFVKYTKDIQRAKKFKLKEQTDWLIHTYSHLKLLEVHLKPNVKTPQTLQSNLFTI